jgi:predicted dehydrogenase
VKTLKVGIIGSGGIAQAVHIPGYLKLPDVQVVALCDTNPDTLKQAAEKFGVKQTFSDWRAMLRKVELDMVNVCTPNCYHAAPTIAALQAGAHCMVEKPMAVSAAQARAMCNAAKKAKRLLMVGQNNRYRSDVQWLRRAAQKGDFGEFYFGEALCVRRRGIPAWGTFIEKKHSGGGALYDLGVHALDMAWYVMGHPKPVTVSGATYAKFGPRKDVVQGMGKFNPKRFDVDDLGVGFIRFANGATLVLKSSWAGNLQDEFSVSVLGTEGGFTTSPFVVYTEAHGNLVNVTPVNLPHVETHAEEIRLFVEAIRKGLPSPIPGEQGLVTTAMLEGIYRSSELGREVRLEV